MMVDSSAPGNGANASPQAGQHDCAGLKSCTSGTTNRAERSLRPWPWLPGCCPRWRGLDVHFISSLPVMQRLVCKAWADKRPVQIVGAVSYTRPAHAVVAVAFG